jgi:N-dimethylarginine dimethylaminohydrolase
MALQETQTADPLLEYPFYEERKPPQYSKYHSEVDYLDELERIWGKRWGAPGIGRLREVAVIKPTEVEVDPLFERDPSFFNFDGTLPDLKEMQEQHAGMVRAYKENGVQVQYLTYPEKPRSAYGVMKRTISAAAGFVIRGGAIIPREATQYWRGRSKYVAKFLMDMGCPILYTVHGKGVCEVGAFTRMSDDFILASLSTDCNMEGFEQVKPILRRAGYTRIHLAYSPGPMNTFYEEQIGWMHSDMWIGPVDIDLAVIYPPFCDYETIRRMKEMKYELIEVPRGEQMALFPCNLVTLEPRKVMIIAGAEHTTKQLEKVDVEVIEVPYDEVLKYGGGLRCTTMQLVRDDGPKLEERLGPAVG